MAGWCPFYDEHGIRLSRVLTDRSTEFCGPRARNMELYLAIEEVGNGRTVPLLIEQANALTYAGVEIAETLLGEARPAVGNPKMY